MKTAHVISITTVSPREARRAVTAEANTPTLYRGTFMSAAPLKISQTFLMRECVGRFCQTKH
jgi:hypothetical protein